MSRYPRLARRAGDQSKASSSFMILQVEKTRTSSGDLYKVEEPVVHKVRIHSHRAKVHHLDCPAKMADATKWQCTIAGRRRYQTRKYVVNEHQRIDSSFSI
ncbi:hypothetical protein PM082_018105 [Marasmius tenuissimus]|nr:hypothetical protein PM082_018105 [Marasmius tenuissimus]